MTLETMASVAPENMGTDREVCWLPQAPNGMKFEREVCEPTHTPKETTGDRQVCSPSLVNSRVLPPGEMEDAALPDQKVSIPVEIVPLLDFLHKAVLTDKCGFGMYCRTWLGHNVG